jgi:hypothetical protein
MHLLQAISDPPDNVWVPRGGRMKFLISEDMYTTQERFFFLAVLDLQLEKKQTEFPMNGLIYLIGLIVVIMAVLSLLGLR